MVKTQQVGHKNSPQSKISKDLTEAKYEKKVTQEYKRDSKKEAKKTNQHDWRILTVILKLMHFAIYASFYLTKIMCEKFSLVKKNMLLII